jgi:hydroxyethylthiazole kinase
MNLNSLSKIRAQAPLVHNITNYVVMNNTANALLAIGASPVMAHSIHEVEAMVQLSQALVINIGTLSDAWIESMALAAQTAARLNIPIVLDPVGCGATEYRTRTALKLLRTARLSVIRGNASEIQALAYGSGNTKGVDSIHTPQDAFDAARELAQTYGCVVSVSGPVDLVVCCDRAAHISNGHPLMTRVTGMGCTSSALTGAFLAVEPDIFNAACLTMVVMGVAGELAAKIAVGPGSFQMHFLDVLHGINESDILQRAQVTWS